MPRLLDILMAFPIDGIPDWDINTGSRTPYVLSNLVADLMAFLKYYCLSVSIPIRA